MTLVNFDHFINDVRKRNSRSINFYPQLLTEVDFDVGHFKCHGFGPAGMFCLTSIVCHTNGECMIDAISRELIFASALETEELSIKGFVMRVTEYCADA